MSSPLVSPAFLFRFAAPCFWRDQIALPEAVGDPAVDAEFDDFEDRYRLPSFGELEGKSLFADLRLAWNHSGLGLRLRVVGKRQLAWCRETRVEDSDGLRLWLDTRDTRNVHLANRFCHAFVLLPFGGGRRADEPLALATPIARAKEQPKPPAPGSLRLRTRKHHDGYALAAFVSADALTGFDPRDHPRLGLSYAVVDRELGWQTFTVGPEFPFQTDPTLWGTLELVGPEK